MCGRFVGYRKLGDYRDKFRIELFEVDRSPNYNVAPTQMIPAIVKREGRNVLREFRWGLVPFWAEDPSIGNRMINARSESVDSKPSFRNAFRKRRCLIPPDGFYEWESRQAPKQPVYITTPDDAPFGFAGLWEVWDNKGKAAPLYTCTILTMDASEAIKGIHHRMPVILKREAYEDWIDEQTPATKLKEILKDKVQEKFRFRPVSKAVNDVANNSEDLIQASSSASGRDAARDALF